MKLHCHAVLRRFAASLAVLVAFSVLSSLSSTAFAQEFPAFGTFVEYTGGSGYSIEGVALASVPAHSQTSELLAVLTTTGGLAVTYSLDGTHFSGFSLVGSTASGLGGIPCSSSENGCSPTVVNFNNQPYIAFQDTNNNLEIAKGTEIAGSNSYTWSLVKTIGTGGGGCQLRRKLSYLKTRSSSSTAYKASTDTTML